MSLPVSVQPHMTRNVSLSVKRDNEFFGEGYYIGYCWKINTVCGGETTLINRLRFDEFAMVEFFGTRCSITAMLVASESETLAAAVVPIL